MSVEPADIMASEKGQEAIRRTREAVKRPEGGEPHPLDTEVCPYCGNDPVDGEGDLRAAFMAGWDARYYRERVPDVDRNEAFDRWLVSRAPDTEG